MTWFQNQKFSFYCPGQTRGVGKYETKRWEWWADCKPISKWSRWCWSQRWATSESEVEVERKKVKKNKKKKQKQFIIFCKRNVKCVLPSVYYTYMYVFTYVRINLWFVATFVVYTLNVAPGVVSRNYSWPHLFVLQAHSRTLSCPQL